MGLPAKQPKGAWVQTERAAHEAWATLLRESQKAAELLHLLVARVGEYNAVVISQPTLAKLMDCHERTVRRAVETLRDRRWIEIRQIGDRGTVNAYVLNRNVVWSGPRDGIRYALFSAAVVVSDQEQPDKDTLDSQEPLRDIPTLYPGEQQLPTGDGLPPPSQPFLDGMEPDLPMRMAPAPDYEAREREEQALIDAMILSEGIDPARLDVWHDIAIGRGAPPDAPLAGWLPLVANDFVKASLAVEARKQAAIAAITASPPAPVSAPQVPDLFGGALPAAGAESPKKRGRPKQR